jgi:FMN phosphatase YigB (HAD superfamily)
MSSKTVIAFDLYGTLLSTESIATELAKHFGEERAEEVAALWRRWVFGLVRSDGGLKKEDERMIYKDELMRYL